MASRYSRGSKGQRMGVGPLVPRTRGGTPGGNQKFRDMRKAPMRPTGPMRGGSRNPGRYLQGTECGRGRPCPSGQICSPWGVCFSNTSQQPPIR